MQNQERAAIRVAVKRKVIEWRRYPSTVELAALISLSKFQSISRAVCLDVGCCGEGVRSQILPWSRGVRRSDAMCWTGVTAQSSTYRYDTAVERRRSFFAHDARPASRAVGCRRATPLAVGVASRDASRLSVSTAGVVPPSGRGVESPPRRSGGHGSGVSRNVYGRNDPTSLSDLIPPLIVNQLSIRLASGCQ